MPGIENVASPTNVGGGNSDHSASESHDSDSVGNPGDVASDRQQGGEGDSLKQGNDFRDLQSTAVEEYNKIAEKYGLSPMGEDANASDQGADAAKKDCPPEQKGSSPSPTDSAQPSGGEEAGKTGEAPSEDEIIKMLAKLLKMPEDQVKQLLEGASSEQDSGSKKPTPTGTQTTA